MSLIDKQKSEGANCTIIWMENWQYCIHLL